MVELVRNCLGRPTLFARMGKWNVAFHMFPRDHEYWHWGYELDWYDGPFWTFGFGRLLEIVVDDRGDG